MGISSTTNWVVRPADGSDNNGGGFDTTGTGTNFTNQASPQYALTGVTSSGAGNTVLSASAANDMVGNVAQVISGTNFNTGFFPIISVSAGAITFGPNNAGQSICSGVGAFGVINIGGALATLSKPLATAGAPVGVSGNLFYLKGTLTISSTQTMPYDCTGSVVLSSAIIGFTTSPGDGGQATWTTATNSTVLIDLAAKSGWSFDNIIFSNTAGTPALGFETTSSNCNLVMFKNCVFDGFTDGINGDNQGARNQILFLYMQDCEIKNCTGKGINQSSGANKALLRGCNVHSNAQGVLTAGIFNAEDSAFSFNTGKGIEQNGGSQTAPVSLNGCCIRDNGSDGLNINVSQPYPLMAWNNIFWNNGGYGINYVNNLLAASDMSQSNAFGSNTSGATHNWPQGTGAITLTADPNTNASANDYTLNNTAGGGALLKAAGYQSSILG